MEHFHCFLAFVIDKRTREAQLTIQHRLSAENVRVRWEPAEKLHTTARFLGDSPPEQLEKLTASLSELVQQIPPFDLVVDSLGAFPSLSRPRVIWAGAYCTDVIAACGDQVEQHCRNAGWSAETREFHPHITLARVRERDDARALTNAVERINFDPILVRTSELVLMRSVILPEGSQYNALASFPFNRSRSFP